jgi:hypothetical protein
LKKEEEEEDDGEEVFCSEIFQEERPIRSIDPSIHPSDEGKTRSADADAGIQGENTEDSHRYRYQ